MPDVNVDTPMPLTRRELIVGALKTMLVATVLPETMSRVDASGRHGAVRAVNIMNFIRAEEPREPMDLMLPVREQMALIKAHRLPATWLLQYDALVEGPFVEFLKAEMPADHEVGIWFEMNRRIIDDAGLEWRGIPDWEWDYHVPVAYAIGYTPDERRKLADTAVATFKRIFGRDVKSVASWNLDAITVAHFAGHHGIDAFGNCRDQLATDGFTIWGCPIAAYYPNRLNAWSPAVDAKNQIDTPIFRLLGQDPVYYYDNTIHTPDTMEPCWPSGQSEVFVDRFLDMLSHKPTQAFGYAQLGQENSFGWPVMATAYAMQMQKLSAAMKADGLIVVETMGETGRRFKRDFRSTPTQAQVMLDDPFGHTERPERTVWYQSKYYRANLHFLGNDFYLRDLHVYNDQFPQPYLTEPVRQHGIEQRLPAVLDGYHWIDGDKRAMGRFVLVDAAGKETSPQPSSWEGERVKETLLSMTGLPIVTEKGSTLTTEVPVAGGAGVVVTFHEREIEFALHGGPANAKLGLKFEWAADLSAFVDVAGDRLNYRFRDFDYGVCVDNGVATKIEDGVSIVTGRRGSLRLSMAQIG